MPSHNMMQLKGNVHTAMTGCEGMDLAQPVLCHAHAHAGGEYAKQSLDTLQLPDVQAFIAIGFVLAFDASLVTAAMNITPTSLQLDRTTAPPITLRNCCFRI